MLSNGILSRAILTLTRWHIDNLCFAGDAARQTAFETIQVPGYSDRSDITAHALTLQLPLEGQLMRGGVTGVIKTKDGQWLHCQHGAAPDFFISTREVGPRSASCGNADQQHPVTLWTIQHEGLIKSRPCLTARLPAGQQHGHVVKKNIRSMSPEIAFGCRLVTKRKA